MGAENSSLKPPPSPAPLQSAKTPETAKKRTIVTRSQYHDLKNPKYTDDDIKTMTSFSAESSISSEESSTSSEEKKTVNSAYQKVVKKKEPTPTAKKNSLKALEGLKPKAKVKKSEEILRQMWKRPPASWAKITDVTSISKEKTRLEGQISEEVRKKVNFSKEKTVYDIPLDRCHLRVPKLRATRSCPDPWRRHGAHAKLCEIGGSYPENKNRNAKSIPVRKGTAPPAEPKTKPLLTMEDYMKLVRK